LSAVRWEGSREILSRSCKTHRAPNYRWIDRACTSLLTTVMACEGLIDMEEAFAIIRKRIRIHLEELEEWEGRSAADLLLRRALAKERKYGLHELAEKVSGMIDAEADYMREPGSDDF